MLATGPRYYAEQQALSASAVKQLNPADDIRKTLRLLAGYQTVAAALAVEHGSAALQEQRISDAGALLVPSGFTVDVDAPSVLTDAKTDFEFARIVSTLVSDSGRSAMGAFTASRRQELGHIRVLTPPSCSRCAILAGRWYRWSEGFKRHPLCDCAMLPAERQAALWDPYAAYERGEISDLTKAQKAAIDEGADIAQVVNATRGMQTISFAGRSVQVTTEGTTSRGLAFSRLIDRGGSQRVDAGFATRITRNGPEERRITKTVAKAPRLSPEACYQVAGGDRDTAVRLLRINGYIV